MNPSLLPYFYLEPYLILLSECGDWVPGDDLRATTKTLRETVAYLSMVNLCVLFGLFLSDLRLNLAEMWVVERSPFHHHHINLIMCSPVSIRSWIARNHWAITIKVQPYRGLSPLRFPVLLSNFKKKYLFIYFTVRSHPRNSITNRLSDELQGPPILQALWDMRQDLQQP